MELVIDVGNNFTKCAVFSDDHILGDSLDLKNEIGQAEQLLELLARTNPKKSVSSAIISTVRPISPELEKFLSRFELCLILSHETPLPIKLNYDTPATLGKDRIAAVVAAHSMYPGENSLAIDAGTCITYDFIDANGVYQGGSISPGLQMRYQALHNFTGALPLIEHKDLMTLVGKSTEDSIKTGVFNGMINEINGTISRYKLEKAGLNLVICGGDARELEPKLDHEVDHVDNLVLIGLHKILKFNELQKNT